MRITATKSISKTASITAPIGGWNVRDSLAEMKPTEAVYLENWWPTTVDCMIRKGFVNWATGLPGTADTIMAYNGIGGTKKLFAFTSTGSIYDVSATGAVGAPIVTGLANGQWQYVSYTNSGGTFLLAFNGLDWGLRYNGTTWVSVTDGVTIAITSIAGNGTIATVTQPLHGLQSGNTITVTGSTPAGLNAAGVIITRIDANTYSYVNATAGTSTTSSIASGEAITGVSPKNIFSLNIFKQKVWLVQKNSLSAWYLPTLAIQGAATEFPLGSLFSQGGSLLSMGTWTIDAGVGIDDNAAFFSTEGEILIYKGTDPSSATTFALVGLFKQGNPIGTRCQIKYLGDVYIITDLGVAPMSESILTAQVTIKSDVTDKILPAISTAVGLARSTFGWQLIAYPVANMLLVNVPTTTGTNYQFVMNTITGSWTKFTGWNARCFEVQGNNLYFGGTGVVALAWSGFTDNTASITADALPAFTAFHANTQIKRMTMVRPILYSTGAPSALISMVFDFDQNTLPAGSLTYNAPFTMIWGSMTWGSMVWGGSLVVNKNWQFASGVGYTVSMRIRINNNASDTRWASTDYVYQSGGIL